ncbi:MAG: hypothetical protein WBA74_06430 [Cyclobacteriaceae bacterium]
MYNTIVPGRKTVREPVISLLKCNLRNFSLLLFFASLFIACEEPQTELYEDFIIAEGKHAASQRPELLQATELKFTAVFDHSAVYESRLKENQHDVNKLLGFSDCNAHHHDDSARFGWRWLNDQLEILAYVYVNGTRIVEPVGTVPLNEPSTYNLKMTESSYVFTLNEEPAVVIDRENDCDKGLYYMLLPYFGGDERAPHDILIRVQRIY